MLAIFLLIHTKSALTLLFVLAVFLVIWSHNHYPLIHQPLGLRDVHLVELGAEADKVPRQLLTLRRDDERVAHHAQVELKVKWN